MKTLIDYLLEAKGQTDDIKLLTKYIYDKIAAYIYAEPSDDDYNTALEEYVEDSDGEFDIPINFSDIPGFKNIHNLRTWHTQNEINKVIDNGDNYDCDMIVRVTDEVAGFGTMETNEPTLNIGTFFINSVKKFEKSSTDLKNTIAHELIHYVQFMGDNESDNARLHNVQFHSGAVSKEMIQNTQGDMRYYISNFIMYAWDPIERDARRSGFYETIKDDLQKRLKEWKKTHKKVEFNKEEFADYCIHHESYDKNTLHIGIFDSFLQSLKDDTWENFAKCIANPKEKYKSDSIIYVVLNIADDRASKPPFPLPAHKNYVLNITGEKRFNQYKEKLIKYFNKDYNTYKKKLKNVVYSVLDENNIK